MLGCARSREEASAWHNQGPLLWLVARWVYQLTMQKQQVGGVCRGAGALWGGGESLGGALHLVPDAPLHMACKARAGALQAAPQPGESQSGLLALPLRVRGAAGHNRQVSAPPRELFPHMGGVMTFSQDLYP